MRSSASPRDYPVYSACILIGAFTLYTLLSSETIVDIFQYPLILGVVALAYLYYRSLGDSDTASASGTTAAVLSLYSITTVVIFYPTIHTLFRSDDWLILSLFESIEGFSLGSVRKIALFEMFGDIRFQPLAHLLLFIRYLLFGGSVLPYHLLNMALHVLTGTGVFLVLNSVTKDRRLSFIVGLIFIALPSQFDTVVWTYHIYIIASTLAVLLAIYLTLEYARTKRRGLLAGALLLTLVSVLFYEPAILAPGALGLIILGLYIADPAKFPRREIAITAGAVVAVYAFYLGLTLYGLSLTRATHFVSFSDMATPGNMAKAAMVTVTNLWRSTFIRNIGISPIVGVDDIIYLMTPKGLYTGFTALVKIALGILLILCLKPTRKQLYLLAALAGLALSYIFIIALGRVLTNPIGYVPTQPRYQYFPNAVLLTAAGVLLVKRFQNKSLRPIFTTLLFALLFWNLRNTIHANNLVAAAISPQDHHYYNIKDFLKSDPGARLLLTFAPESDWKFALGTDISFDILFTERLTKFPKKATHIYDGERFMVNPHYRKDPAGEGLGDFTAEWVFYRRKKTVPANPIRIIGPAGTYPQISITTDGLLRVDMALSGAREGEIHTFSQPYPKAPPDDPGPTHMVHMIVEKDDNVLCLAYNGVLAGRMELGSSYNDWNGDGLGLYGEYFRGSGEPVGIVNLRISPGAASYGCKARSRGDIIAPVHYGAEE